MHSTRRHVAAEPASAASASAAAPPFGSRRIYYNNFAEHLQNAFNPNLLYPDLPNRWHDEEWRALVDMVAAFGFNVFEFWLVPRLFCRAGLDSDFGREFTRQMRVVIEHAHRRGLQVEFIAGLATVGDRWHTLCPQLPDEWAEIQDLWTAWTERLEGIDIAGVFPGDPGACSRNGCSAITYVDRSLDIACRLAERHPGMGFELNLWGPPVFGWGIIHGPPGWQGEFVAEYQSSAWTFDRRRADVTMTHVLQRLPEFPPRTWVGQNLGFNPDGNPTGDQDARQWVRQIARSHPVLTWDFSLTEGENNVLPHYRLERLFERRRQERAAAPYSGGICFTMTPLLNQLSLYASAQSFLNPDAEPGAVADRFAEALFGPPGQALTSRWVLFEVVRDWGCYVDPGLDRAEYHRQIGDLAELLRSLTVLAKPALPLHPSPEVWRRDLVFFAELLRDLSAPGPDYDALWRRYWDRVYAIYDRLPEHVDPRPRQATDRLVNRFREWA
jgi:hypothetical protein